jgi:hypothetical protein
MPKKKAPPLTPAEQRKRLEELARQAGAAASSKDLRETVRRIARAGDKTAPKKTKK